MNRFKSIIIGLLLVGFAQVAQADFFAYQEWTNPRTGQVLHEYYDIHMSNNVNKSLKQQQDFIKAAKSYGKDALAILEDRAALMNFKRAYDQGLVEQYLSEMREYQQQAQFVVWLLKNIEGTQDGRKLVSIVTKAIDSLIPGLEFIKQQTLGSLRIMVSPLHKLHELCLQQGVDSVNSEFRKNKGKSVTVQDDIDREINAYDDGKIFNEYYKNIKNEAERLKAREDYQAKIRKEHFEKARANIETLEKLVEMMTDEMVQQNPKSLMKAVKISILMESIPVPMRALLKAGLNKLIDVAEKFVAAMVDLRNSETSYACQCLDARMLHVLANNPTKKHFMLAAGAAHIYSMNRVLLKDGWIPGKIVIDSVLEQLLNKPHQKHFKQELFDNEVSLDQLDKEGYGIKDILEFYSTAVKNPIDIAAITSLQSKEAKLKAANAESAAVGAGAGATTIRARL